MFLDNLQNMITLLVLHCEIKLGDSLFLFYGLFMFIISMFISSFTTKTVGQMTFAISVT